MIGRLARERVETVGRLTGEEKKVEDLARRSREALDRQVSLAESQEKQRDDVRERLHAVEELLASLTPEELAALAELEKNGIAEEQERFMASGALGDDGKPSAGARGRCASRWSSSASRTSGAPRARPPTTARG